MTDYAAQYQQLSSRRESILQQVAVAESREAANKERREQLEAELKAAGVDPTRPEEEAARLQREIEADRTSVAEQLDEIEKQLGGTSSTPAAPPQTPPSASAVGDDDLDLS